MFAPGAASESPKEFVAGKDFMMNTVQPNQLRILVADDDESILALYRQVLSPDKHKPEMFSELGELAGKLFGENATSTSALACELVECRQGAEAVGIVKRSLEEHRPFAMAFLDVRMPPGPDGVWTAEQIRSLDPQIEIVIVTGYSDVNPRGITARIAPAHKLLYIQKPFHSQEIHQFASALGSKWHTEGELRKVHAELERRVQDRTVELMNVNKQLKKEIEERKRADILIHTQRNLGLALSATSGLDEGLRLCVEAALHVSEMDCGGVYLIDKTSGTLNLVFHKGLPPDFVKNASHYAADSTNTRLVMAGRPVYTEHLKLGVPLDEAKQRESLRAIAVLPMRHKDRVIGCLNIASHTLDEVPVFSRVTLEAIATQVGRAVARLRAEEALRESEAKFRTIFEKTAVGILIVDEKTRRYLRVNPAFEAMSGYRAEELFRMSPPELTHPEDSPSEEKLLLELRSGKRDQYGLEKRYTRKDGGCFWGRVVVTLVRSVSDRPDYTVSIVEDITDHRRAEETLRESEERHRIVLEAVPDSVVVYDMEGKVTYLNPAFSRVFGWTLNESIGRNIDFVPVENLPDNRLIFAKINRDETISGIESYRLTKGGTRIDVSISGAGFFDSHGKPQGSVITLQDISERKRTEEKIRFIAYHDVLTGLPNRKSFYMRLEDELVRSRSQAGGGRRVKNHKWALFFLDIDRFKYVNDTLGHDAGDELLKLMGARIQSCLRKSDYVFRLGGDEFTIILNDLINDTDVIKVIQKIREKVAQPCLIKGHELYMTVSIGVSIYPDDGEDVERLVKNADMAMYAAKEGEQGYCFFTEEMNRKALERMKMESNLRNALQNNQFVIYYQPLVDDKNRIIGMEALLRWRHPELGMISPSQFIPLAEETRAIVSIGKRVLHSACKQTRKWHKMGYPDLYVAVNLSARQFSEPDLIETIEQVFKATDLPPDCLKLEITESSIMENPEQAIAKMKILCAKGIHFAIDDFGTGYSSLSYLKRFPVDTLKIDRSFVIDSITNKDDQEIIKTIIAMARNLGMDVIAEGVETKEQLDFLARQGCHILQGYYFGRPMPAEKFEEMLQTSGSV